MASLRNVLRGGRQSSRRLLPTPRRSLHLAPPFLLDTHLAKYRLLSDSEVVRKRDEARTHLSDCNLCPRRCGVNRYESRGYCLIGSSATVSTIAPHFGEEPFFQGHNGSGSVFFSGCSLRCAFCQNHDISHQKAGMDVTPEELGEWFMKLQTLGNVHNINLVTPEHVVPQCVLAILHARSLGLTLPVIYNTSAYDSLTSINLMDGLVDIYLPDFKCVTASTSRRLLKADDYPETAKESIKAMYDQVGDLCFTPDGIAKQGVCVRHLVMPGKEDEGKEIVKWLADHVSKDLMVNVMEQYHPRAHVGKPRRKTGSVADGDSAAAREDVRYAEINRPVSHEEVGSVRKAAEDAGLWRFVDAARHGGFNI